MEAGLREGSHRLFCGILAMTTKYIGLDITEEEKEAILKGEPGTTVKTEVAPGLIRVLHTIPPVFRKIADDPPRFARARGIMEWFRDPDGNPVEGHPSTRTIEMLGGPVYRYVEPRDGTAEGLRDSVVIIQSDDFEFRRLVVVRD